MKYLFDNFPEIKNRLRAPRGCLLLLDFDGTLSPIELSPALARLPKGVKLELKKYSRIFPVGVISGRKLSDIKNKVGLKNLVYSGNHGLDWQIGGKINRAPGAERAAKPLAKIFRELRQLPRSYPGVLLEYKGLSLAVHYRKLRPSLVPQFKKDAGRLIGKLIKGKDLQILNDNKALELRPKVQWDKGKFALAIWKYFEKNLKRELVPVYAGDDTTDEDAFRALKTGITIRVGRSQNSNAKYYIRNTGQVKLFIRQLLKIISA
ncbi:MAG: trehalose-phosphatase [Candidatus Doudnabacteria bacterium]|nr:trehalose-phosphatase [Candidatus Doudnabacteria bacterium]